MKFYIDSSDLEQIKKWKFLVSGCTTNPKILARDGVKNIEKTIKAIADENLDVSVELLSGTYSEMLEEAISYARISSNVVIKVPVLNYDSLKLIHALETEGILETERSDRIRCNATGCCSINQAVMAALAGVSFVSLFWCRVGDEGGLPYNVVVETRQALAGIRQSFHNTDVELIVGSLRSVEDVNRAISAGADILTITPDLLEKLVKNAKTVETINEFNEAWKAKK